MQTAVDTYMHIMLCNYRAIRKTFIAISTLQISIVDISSLEGSNNEIEATLVILTSVDWLAAAGWWGRYSIYGSTALGREPV